MVNALFLKKEITPAKMVAAIEVQIITEELIIGDHLDSLGGGDR